MFRRTVVLCAREQVVAPFLTLGARMRILAVAAGMQPEDPVALRAADSVEALLGLLQLPQYAAWFKDEHVRDASMFLRLEEHSLEEVQVSDSDFLAVPSAESRLRVRTVSFACAHGCL